MLTVVVFIDFVLTYVRVLDTKNAHSTCKQTRMKMIFILAHAIKSLRYVFLSFSKVITIIPQIKLTTVRKIKLKPHSHIATFLESEYPKPQIRIRTIFKRYPPHNSNSSIFHKNTGCKEEIFLNVSHHHYMRSVRFKI